MQRKISIAIPTYNRFEMTVAAFEQVLQDDRVNDVTIIDDCSTDGSFDKLVTYFENSDKVFVRRNQENLDCYKNKAMAVRYCVNTDWCILFDSDNILTTGYLDTLYNIPEWDTHTIYQPVYSRPHFDFRNYAGLTVTSMNVSQFTETNMMTALNAMNFFINREEYLRVWDGSVDPVTSDSIYFNYCWLVAGNKVYMTPGLEYDHLVHQGSHYQNNVNRTAKGFHEDIINKLKQLR